MRKLLVGLLLIILVVGCGSKKEESSLTKVVIGSKGSDAQIWEYIASLEETKEAGLVIEVKELTSGPVLNEATAVGEVDVNAFQSLAYLETFNKDSKNKLVPIGTTYIEPSGLYSKKFKKLEDITEGSLVAISDNPAGQVRALRLLEKAKLITLKDDFDLAIGTTNDIKDNPLNLKFKEIEDNSGPRILEDVDLVIIGNTIALEGGLNVLKDSLYYEEVSVENKLIINALVTSEARKDDKNLLKLYDLYHLPIVQEYINKEFDGTKVEVKIPVEQLIEK